MLFFQSLNKRLGKKYHALRNLPDNVRASDGNTRANIFTLMEPLKTDQNQ